MSYIDEFIQAVHAEDEAKAEALSYHLQPADEATLLAILERSTLSKQSTLSEEHQSESKEPSSDLQWWAIRALALCGTATAAPILASFLVAPEFLIASKIKHPLDDEATLRCATAALAFGHLHQREPAAVLPHLPKLAAQLAHGDGFVRQAASDALALCGDAAVPALEEVLNGTNDGARSRAAYALRKIGSLKVAPALFQHLNDPHYLVRLHAYEGLDEMGLLDNVILEI